MTLDEIRIWRNAEPFRPFQIDTTEGKSIYVGGKEKVGFAPDGTLVAVFEGNRFHSVPLSEVSGVKAFVPRIRHKK